MLFTQTLHDHFAFRPKRTVHNRCSPRGYMVPLFSSKQRELITGDNLGRSSDAFLHLVAKGAQVLSAGLPFHLKGRHFVNYSYAWTADF